jgi:hypothetical protein
LLDVFGLEHCNGLLEVRVLADVIEETLEHKEREAGRHCQHDVSLR